MSKREMSKRDSKAILDSSSKKRTGASRSDTGKKPSIKKRVSKKKADKKGAIRSVEKTNEPRLWGRYVFFVAVFGAFAWFVKDVQFKDLYETVNSSWVSLLESKQKPIKSVQVEGDFEYISHEQLQKMLLKRVSGDFVDVDIKTIQKELSENEWVFSVAVNRVWPDALKVIVVEQQPIALWGDRGFLNRFGEVIITKDIDVIKHLPTLDGDSEFSDDVAKKYLVVAQMFSSQGLTVTSLSIDDKGAWEVGVDHQFTLFVGQNELTQKLENFLYVYEQQLKDTKSRISTVDLRYESGMAVSWNKEKSHFLTSQ